MITLRDVVKQRKIPWLCHFTPKENIESIKRYGLVLRNQLTEFRPTDTSRYDIHRNAICLSISQPNQQLLWVKRTREELDLSLIILKPNILYEKDCLFFPHNAATASYRSMPSEQFRGVSALERMFADTISYQKSNCNPETVHRDVSLCSCETTSNQAEVQCLENIETGYIWLIIDLNKFSDLNELYQRMSLKYQN